MIFTITLALLRVYLFLAVALNLEIGKKGEKFELGGSILGILSEKSNPYT